MPDKITSNVDGMATVTPIVTRETETGETVRVLDAENAVAWTPEMVERTRVALVKELEAWRNFDPLDEITRCRGELKRLDLIEAAIT